MFSSLKKAGLYCNSLEDAHLSKWTHIGRPEPCVILKEGIAFFKLRPIYILKRISSTWYNESVVEAHKSNNSIPFCRKNNSTFKTLLGRIRKQKKRPAQTLFAFACPQKS